MQSDTHVNVNPPPRLEDVWTGFLTVPENDSGWHYIFLKILTLVYLKPVSMSIMPNLPCSRVPKTCCSAQKSLDVQYCKHLFVEETHWTSSKTQVKSSAPSWNRRRCRSPHGMFAPRAPYQRLIARARVGRGMHTTVEVNGEFLLCDHPGEGSCDEVLSQTVTSSRSFFRMPPFKSGMYRACKCISEFDNNLFDYQHDIY